MKCDSWQAPKLGVHLALLIEVTLLLKETYASF